MHIAGWYMECLNYYKVATYVTNYTISKDTYVRSYTLNFDKNSCYILLSVYINVVGDFRIYLPLTNLIREINPFRLCREKYI